MTCHVKKWVWPYLFSNTPTIVIWRKKSGRDLQTRRGKLNLTYIYVCVCVCVCVCIGYDNLFNIFRREKNNSNVVIKRKIAHNEGKCSLGLLPTFVSGVTILYSSLVGQPVFGRV